MSTDPLTISSLFPELDDRSGRRADEHLDAYLALVERIHRRLRADPASAAELEAALSQRPAASGPEPHATAS